MLLCKKKSDRAVLASVNDKKREEHSGAGSWTPNSNNQLCE